MSNSLENPAEFAVSDLFTSGQYIIPMYQRNYAWGKTEIEQLLQDLMDKANHHINTTQSEDSNYFLGSLVVHQRKDAKFEIIDGQQRHTTLCILMAVLKNEYEKNIVSQGINLAFDHRSLSSETLKLLFDNGLKSDTQNMESAMVAAYKIAQTYLKNPPDNQKFEIKKFAEYLASNVKLLRVIVPEDTDLNHYFEIMNSRGEQLEKHEVLKARLMEPLEKEEQNTFAKIWEACADMSRYVQLGFSASKSISENTADGEKASERVAVFGADWNQCPENFDALVKSVSSEASSSEGKTLVSVLDEPVSKTKKDTDIEEGKYNSVINFPNFLLQVLSLLYPNSDVALDDKKLLDSFEKHPKYIEKSTQFAKDFIVALLQTRFLFDNWIIKSTSDGDGDHWRLRIIKPPADKSSYSFANSVADKKINDQLIMMLSMRHVSFPSQNYKQWLREALGYLYKNKRAIVGGQYLASLEKLSDDYFTEKCTDDNVLHKGTGVLHFFFNRLDYLLWKGIVIGNVNEMPSICEDKAIDDVKKIAEKFKFTFRSSIEHYYPQHPDSGEMMENCDRFGNLCLISHSNNSRYSNLDVAAKKSHRKNSNANESLKQIIMMSYDEWGPSEQGLTNIKNHEEKMIALLKCTQQ
ncbi:MAG: DUF262 domain-containing protein [Methylotenera sp.]|nr:DUF262 domain-containing protein [Methylotenera sp.]MDD4926989.1 DUF262 domain-containing protein [Methylotenera sp.]